MEAVSDVVVRQQLSKSSALTLTWNRTLTAIDEQRARPRVVSDIVRISFQQASRALIGQRGFHSPRSAHGIQQGQ